MPSSFAEAVRTVHAVLGSSAVLQRLGYAACSRELSEETQALPAMCRFTIQTSGNRCLVINFCYHQSGDHFFTVEVFNPPAATSFLLDEWLSWHGVALDPYPFILSSYAGTDGERLAGFVTFLEWQFSSASLGEILSGRKWLDIPFNWGAIK